MKTLICYKSKHGATEQYAKWLAQETKADLKQFEDVPRGYKFEGYDTVVVSSGTYASLMPLNRFLKRHWKNLEPKKVVVFAVGAAPADDPWSARSYNWIPKKIQAKIKYFKILGEVPENARPAGYKSQVKKENLTEIIKELK